MLVLSRQPGEAITIGDDLEIRVLRLKDGEVRLGLTAPQDVLILRSELLDRPAPKCHSHTTWHQEHSASRRNPASRRR